jgi:hypothetical protein
MIKRILCVACLCFLGCCEATNQPETPKWVPAFKVGDLIKIRVSDVKGQVVNISERREEYYVRYMAMNGMTQDWLKEYEVESLER